MRPRLSLKNALWLAVALTLGLATAPTRAGSSSVGSLGSESVGSLSTSIQQSSNSSSHAVKLAQGDYTIVEVADAPQQPDRVRLRLQAVAPIDPLVPQGFDLLLPRNTLARSGLGPGDTLQVQPRAYGIAFAARRPLGQVEPFFLVLEDDWYRELDSRPVTL